MSDARPKWYGQVLSCACLLAFFASVLLWQKYAAEQVPEEAEKAEQAEAVTSTVTRGPALLSHAICTEFKRPCGETARILNVVLEEAARHDIDPALAVGIALRESGFRPDARSSTGDHGLLQVNYKWHGYKVKRLRDLYDVRTNVRIGLGYLQELLSKTEGNVKAALRMYNGKNAQNEYPAEVTRKAGWAAQFL